MTIESLVGKTVKHSEDTYNFGKYGDITIKDIAPWTKEGLTRDYINLEGSGARLIAKLFQPIQGRARCDFAIDTPHGRICGDYGAYANSGAKRAAAVAMVTALFA